MLPNSIDKETTSPADELFHYGKLLPLHLHFGTTQMVEKLLQNPNKSVHGTRKNDVFDESFSTPLFTTTTNTPTNNTPFESCNISPVKLAGNSIRRNTSPSSNNSNEFQEMHFFKRSSSAYSDIENSIQAAIAHCKNSQQQFNSRKTISDIGVCSLLASKVIIQEQERPGLCRG
ncbi:hypothetical protein RND71_025873 [Anisodus tanguticus]|uniref:Uncharacterized protein n=1 Tax=Anisodus tanguticus TaxID=243964 RepID=A0AAE1V9X6_9SOLA|nr:hypothetical protein RND71_025873 [Anisodus tanguticus]